MIKRYFLILSAAVLMSGPLFSQDELTDAFRKSYYSESYQNYAEAIASLIPVYQADSYIVNYRMGWLHYANGDYMESKRYYEKAIELEPKSIEARLGYAYPLDALAEVSGLEKNYQAILKIDPLHTTANYRLALINYNKKDFNKAHAYLETVLELLPFDYDSILLMAAVNVGLGNIEEAKKYYRKALLYYPDNTAVAEELKKL